MIICKRGDADRYHYQNRARRYHCHHCGHQPLHRRQPAYQHNHQVIFVNIHLLAKGLLKMQCWSIMEVYISSMDFEGRV